MINKIEKFFLKNIKLKKFIFLLIFIISFLYSTTFQIYRLLDLDNIPGGLSDTKNYIEMSKGNYATSAHHRYRFIIPSTVSLIKPAIKEIVSEPNVQVKVSFYIVNFIIILVTSLFLYYLIEDIGLPTYSALLGVSIFLSSRQTSIVAATPLVDSLALLACVFFIYTTYSKKYKLLTFTLPFVALTKDTSFPLLIIPLFSKQLKKIPYFISLAISFLGVVISRNIIDYYAGQSSIGEAGTGLINYLSIIYFHSQSIFNHFLKLFTIKGIHDFTHGFSLFMLIALFGYFINRKNKLAKISNEMHSLIPLGFLISMYSGNLGRLFYHYAFPTVIIYALIFIDWFINKLSIQNKLE